MGTTTRTVTSSKQQPGAVSIAYSQKSNRNLSKGVWELARLHTKEAWLCWYPAGRFMFFHHAERQLTNSSMGRVSFSWYTKHQS